MVVAAAGNDGTSVQQLADPAYDPRIISVGSFDPNLSTNPELDAVTVQQRWIEARGASTCSPPVQHIVSLRDPGSYVDSNFPDSQVGTRFTRGSGTSQAAAVTSGLIADLFEKFPNATPDQIKNLLVKTLTPFTASSQASNHGHDDEGDQNSGMINGLKAMAGKELTKNSNGRQDFTYAKGTGSLELSRGDMHLSNGTSGLDRRAGHLRQRLEPASVGDGVGERHHVAGRPVERAALERRRLGRATLVERHLDRQRLERPTLERPTLVGSHLGRAALERPTLERRRLGRPTLERPTLEQHPLGSEL